MSGPAGGDFSGGVLGRARSLAGPDVAAAPGRTGAEADLQLCVSCGHQEPWNANRALRLMQAAAEDFAIEARFLSTPTARHQLQGIRVDRDASSRHCCNGQNGRIDEIVTGLVKTKGHHHV